VNEKTRTRLHQQGFAGIDDAMLSLFAPWLKVAPAVCAFVTLIGTIMRSPVVLWSLTLVALTALITRKHPADLIYDLIARPILGRKRWLPLYGAPRRFSAGLAAVWLLVTGMLFWFGANTLGTVLGLGLAGPLALAAINDVCTGCIMYHRLKKLELPSEPLNGVKWRDVTEPRFRIGGRPSRSSYS
jgi:hypothetical protein